MQSDEPDPLMYSALLQKTKTHAKQLGKLGDAAKKVIAERRELQSQKGKKVYFVVLGNSFAFVCSHLSFCCDCSESGLWNLASWQRS